MSCLQSIKNPQENYFGEDDMYTDFEEAVSSPVLSTSTSGLGWSPLGMEDSEQKESSDIHPLDLRPWDITVLINLYKVHGRLPVVGFVTACSSVYWFGLKIKMEINVFLSLQCEINYQKVH